MFYAIRVNSALAMLGVNPTDIRAEYRQGAQMMGKMSGNSPQEVALFIASQLPIALQLDLNPVVAKAWIRKGKLNPRDPEMRSALDRLGWYELASY